MKYLKSYMGVSVSSGSYMERDDGYLEMKLRTYNSIEELSRDFGKGGEGKYYKLTEIDENALKEEVLKSLIEQEESAKEKKRVNIQKQIDELQKQLKNLS